MNGNKKFRVGIIGTGWIAEKMAETLLAMPDAEPYAVASRKQERADEFAKRFGIPHAYGTYGALARDKNVDLAYIATPHSEHFDGAALCIANLKPVLVEKAFTAVAWQAEVLLKEAKKLNTFVAEAIWTRYMPLSLKAIEIARSGEIGEIKMVNANLSYPVIDRPRLSMPELAGGALLDLGVYPLNFAAMILGDDVRRVRSNAILTKSGVDEADNIMLEFGNGAVAMLQSSANCRSDRRGVVSGTKGQMIVENINNPERIIIQNENFETVRVIEAEPQISGYEYQVLACRDAIAEGKIETPYMPHAETIRMMHQMDSLRKSWGVSYPWDD